MDSRALLAALKRRREKKVELGNGKSVTFLRPTEADMGAMLAITGDKGTWNVGIEQVRKFVVGWSGFTEADLLGAAIGASDPVEFDAELWAEVCSDDIAWVRQVADAILTSVVDHVVAKDSAAKNSVGDSTSKEPNSKAEAPSSP